MVKYTNIDKERLKRTRAVITTPYKYNSFAGGYG